MAEPHEVVGTNAAELLARLSQHRMLARIPRAELEWLGARGALFRMELGNLVLPNPVLMESLVVLLSGHFAIYVDHGAGRHKVMEWGAGDVSGRLPYSRMSKPVGEILVDEAGELFIVHSRHFSEMIRECPVLTAELVHLMVDRARYFRSSELQDEKMLSLGKLAAGLAHELNNPASAAARSARLLSEALAESEASARALGAARLTEAQLAAIEGARYACATAPASALSPVERADREETLAHWLEAHGGDASAAAALADTTVTIRSLDALAQVVDGDNLQAALRWVAAGCTTRALASEVERAAERVHKLVGAVKRFAYMDRAQAPDAVDLAGSINDSVTLLLHKARKKSVGLDVKLEPNLPRVRAIGGDLNQVWTNLIDNALDAVPESGHVSVEASRHSDLVTVRVIDDGTGIPSEIRDHIFDPFFTSKPVGQGTGLGLDIARQLVRRNDGDIEVDSRPGRTEFRVTLRVAADAATTGAA
jgi:signal transduction histidine kinase